MLTILYWGVIVLPAEVKDSVLLAGGVSPGLCHDGRVVEGARRGGERDLTETCRVVQELWGDEEVEE